jgi:hypothetical protein
LNDQIRKGRVGRHPRRTDRETDGTDQKRVVWASGDGRIRKRIRTRARPADDRHLGRSWILHSSRPNHAERQASSKIAHSRDAGDQPNLEEHILVSSLVAATDFLEPK